MKFQAIHQDCHPDLVHALGEFNNKITSSHSTAARSNKDSIWFLLKKEVEPAIIKILGVELMCVIAKHGFSNDAKNEARKLEDRIRRVNRHYSRLESKAETFGVLETLIYLIHFCKSFRPHTYTERLGNNPKGKPVGRKAYRVGLEHFPFCELCEHLCESEELKVLGKESKYPEGSSPSSRFCENHRPGSKAYRRDHNRRDIFHEKIRELEYALGHKSYTEGIEELKGLLEDPYDFDEAYLSEVWGGNVESEMVMEKLNESVLHIKNYPSSYCEFDANIRLAAYLAVHPKKGKTRRKTSMMSKGDTLRRLREAIANGMSISKAAESVGISRQAGWATLKRAGDI